MAENTIVTAKKKILSSVEYARICQFINGYHGGLPIDCELEMIHRAFVDVNPMALNCILQSELYNKTRGSHWRHEGRAKKLLQTYVNNTNCFL